MLDVQVAVQPEPSLGVPAAVPVRANLAQIHRARPQQRRRGRRVGRAAHNWVGVRPPGPVAEIVVAVFQTDFSASSFNIRATCSFAVARGNERLPILRSALR